MAPSRFGDKNLGFFYGAQRIHPSASGLIEIATRLSANDLPNELENPLVNCGEDGGLPNGLQLHVGFPLTQSEKGYPRKHRHAHTWLGWRPK